MIRLETNIDGLVKCLDSWIKVHELPKLDFKQKQDRAAWWYDDCFITAIEQSDNCVLVQFQAVPPGIMKAQKVNKKVFHLLRLTFAEKYTPSNIVAQNININSLGMNDYPEFATIQIALPQTIDEALKELFGSIEQIEDKPNSPSKDANLDTWFDWYHQMQEKGYKVTLKDIATKTGYSKYTIRNRHAEYLAEIKE